MVCKFRSDSPERTLPMLTRLRTLKIKVGFSLIIETKNLIEMLLWREQTVSRWKTLFDDAPIRDKYPWKS